MITIAKTIVNSYATNTPLFRNAIAGIGLNNLVSIFKGMMVR